MSAPATPPSRSTPASPAPLEAPSRAPGTKRLELDPGLPLAHGLEKAMEGVIRYAQEWAAKADAEPEPAVHNFRKSIRRARALLKLMRNQLGRPSYEELVEDLRGAMRETSAARDADVMVSLVAAYPRKPKTAAALDALQALLEEQRRAVHSKGRLARALAEGARSLEEIPPRFGQLLPEGLHRGGLFASLEAGHRRARKAYRTAQGGESDDDFHDWRKRVKELRYQLELLLPLTGKTKEHERLALLAEELGAITDLVVMRDCVLAHRERLEETQPEPLLKKLEKKIDKQQRLRYAEAEDLFGLKPRVFARRVLAGVERASASGRLLSPKE